ncbi:hypothetical protein P171DRAFT_483382 [Karstenula rhodostoma CBS 690.94]|uniref:Uncharacterized protein n=1 Tax=Karstenula rhodostoma CBS 690.94 TaxID=1392251 RepID=A0A9P4PQV6_9PLEO|nr:hypothetical protein P171DRAFT_483382 [Karstenula rhodostoma CBS 690.94]
MERCDRRVVRLRSSSNRSPPLPSRPSAQVEPAAENASTLQPTHWPVSDSGLSDDEPAPPVTSSPLSSVATLTLEEMENDLDMEGLTLVEEEPPAAPAKKDNRRRIFPPLEIGRRPKPIIVFDAINNAQYNALANLGKLLFYVEVDGCWLMGDTRAATIFEADAVELLRRFNLPNFDLAPYRLPKPPTKAGKSTKD